MVNNQIIHLNTATVLSNNTLQSPDSTRHTPMPTKILRTYLKQLNMETAKTFTCTHTACMTESLSAGFSN